MSKQSFFGGLAVFSMFFGSGNLIFPLLIGKEAHEHWFISIFGLGISGVLLPLLGLVTMLLIKGNMEVFFEGLFNKVGAYAAAIVILALCGPLGVIPRCITVAEGAWHTFFPYFHGNLLFVGVCCFIIWCSVYFQTNLLDLIGKYFTPFKLLGLLTIIFSSIYVALKTHTGDFFTPSAQNASMSFTSGLVQGYGTMDLFAALFFGPVVVAYFTKPHLTSKQINKQCVAGVVFGFSIIFFVYACLIYLGSFYSNLIKDIEPTMILPTIVNIALGKYSSYVVSLTLIIATLVTAIALTSVTVDYITSKIKFLSKKRALVLNLSIVVTFVFSSLGFSSIMTILTPVLNILYPLTIVILVMNLVKYLKRKNTADLLHRETSKKLSVEDIGLKPIPLPEEV